KILVRYLFPCFEQSNLQPGFRELLGGPSARRAGTHYNGVKLFFGRTDLGHTRQVYCVQMSFAGKRVLSLESRRAQETAELIRRHNGVPISAPSMREVPIENNESAFRFAHSLFEGEFDMMIFLTGVGTRFLNKVIATRYPAERFAEALRGITV